MVIECPYCSSEVILKGLRPGEFTPICDHCQQRFDLIVPSDPKSRPTVRPIIPDKPATPETAAPSVHKRWVGDSHQTTARQARRIRNNKNHRPTAAPCRVRLSAAQQISPETPGRLKNITQESRRRPAIAGKIHARSLRRCDVATS